MCKVINPDDRIEYVPKLAILYNRYIMLGFCAYAMVLCYH